MSPWTQPVPWILGEGDPKLGLSEDPQVDRSQRGNVQVSIIGGFAEFGDRRRIDSEEFSEFGKGERRSPGRRFPCRAGR